jgi:hypothetical protein
MVDAGTVDWLKSGALFASATDAAVAAAWGEDAIETEIVSCLALEADALIEAARQQELLEGPLAVETHEVPGLVSHLALQPVTLTCSKLGYQAGLTVFVIFARERDDVRRTVLTVLRKLS